MSDIFISYSRKDIAFARMLHEALKANDLQTWIDWQDIEPATDWLEEVYAAIAAADNFVFIISEHSLNSRVCSLEIERAQANHKRLIPIIVQDIHSDGVPKALADINWIAFPAECRDAADEHKFQKALSDLKKAITTDQPWVKEHTRLQVRALEWERGGRERSALLRGRELEQAEAWLARGAEKDPKPTDLQAEFLLVSRRESSRRQRLTLAAVAVALVITAVLAVFAWNASRENAALAGENANIAATAQSNEALARSNAATAEAASTQAVYQKNVAEEQARLARAGNLAAQSSSAVSSSPELALLLGAESFATADTFQSRNSLLTALVTYDQIQRMFQTPDDISRVAFSPDGQRMAAGVCAERDNARSCIQYTIEIWNTLSGQKDGDPIPVGDKEVSALAFSPDGKVLASSTYARVIQFWDVATHQEASPAIDDLLSGAATLVFTPDGLQLIGDICREFSVTQGGYCANGEIDVWDWSSATKIYGPYEAGSIMDHGLTLTPDGTQVLAGGCAKAGVNESDIAFCEQGGVRIIDLHDGSETLRPLEGLSGVSSLALSPDGQTLYASDVNGISSWDTATWEANPGSWANNNMFTGIALSPDGTLLAAAQLSENTIKIWDAQKGTLLTTISTAFTGIINDLTFTPDSQSLVSTACRTTASGSECFQGDIIFWNTTRRQPTQKILSSAGYHQWDGAWRARTGQWIAVQADEADIEVWDAAADQPAAVLHSQTKVDVLALSQDGERLATVGCLEKEREGSMICALSTIQLWDLQTLKPVFDLEVKGWVYKLALDAHGDWLAVNGEDNVIRLIDGSAGKLVEPALQGLTNAFFDFDFSPDGQTLIATACSEAGLQGECSGGEIRLWSLPDGQPLGDPIGGLQKEPDVFAFAPGGDLYFNMNNSLYRLDLASREVEGPILTKTGSSLAFSPDGRYLVTGDRDAACVYSCNQGMIQIWDIEKKQALGLPFKGQAFIPERLVFNPQGTELLSVGNRGVNIWAVTPSVWHDLACQMANRALTPQEWSIYLEGNEYQPSCR